MNSKKIFLLATILVLAILLVTTSVFAQDAVITEDRVVWRLTRLTVIRPGEVIEMPEGILVQGIVLEGKANARGRNVVPEGKFMLTLDAFWPKQNMPAQDTGFWYIQGNWSISKKGATSSSLETRHSRDVINGHMKAQLTFNPFESYQAWSALATVPMSPALGRWSNGEGSITFDSTTEGHLFLDLIQMPEVP